MIRAATLNIRNRQSRWRERRRLLVGQLLDANLDLIALQEVARGQGRWLRNQINARQVGSPYRLVQKQAGLFGWRVAILTRLPLLYADDLDLGEDGRLALRVNVELPTHQTLDFVTTHFTSNRLGQEARLQQAMQVTGWLASDRQTSLQILAGDFNEIPQGDAIHYIKQSFHSAYERQHGREPLATFPTALVERNDDWSGCLDYIFHTPPLRPLSVSLFCDKPDESDDRLFASDHVGVLAEMAI